jgi:hypothetical protein
MPVPMAPWSAARRGGPPLRMGLQGDNFATLGGGREEGNDESDSETP